MVFICIVEDSQTETMHVIVQVAEKRAPPASHVPHYSMESFISTGVASGATHAGLPSADVEQVKVAVLAAGAFGMAMATIAARRKHDVVIYTRDAEAVSRSNPRYFCVFGETLTSLPRTHTRMYAALLWSLLL